MLDGKMGTIQAHGSQSASYGHYFSTCYSYCARMRMAKTTFSENLTELNYI